MTERGRHPLSRRAFLARSGQAAASVTLATSGQVANPWAAAPIVERTTLGRPFRLTNVYQHPYITSVVIGHLPPSSSQPILGEHGDWYQVAHGYVPRTAMQPIHAYQPPTLIETVGNGQWAQVITPTSVVREWCSPSAPIVSTLGYGAVAYVVDKLTTEHGLTWYGLAADTHGELVGWASAYHYQPLQVPHTAGAMPFRIAQLIIQQRARLILAVDQRGARLAQLPYSGQLAALALAEPATVMLSAPGGSTSDQPFGVPWLMRLSTGALWHGAWWHNAFGLLGISDTVQTHTTAGLQFPISAAQWLYHQLAGQGDLSNVQVTNTI